MKLGCKMKRTHISIYIIFLLVSSSLFGIFLFEDLVVNEISVSGAKSIIVDINGNGNYTSIQAAINNSSAGDTIHVWNGTYYESLVINKSITLIGNNSKNTIINAGSSSNVIEISADWVNISNFSITSGYDGIYLNNVKYCSISNNNFTYMNNGIHLLNSNFNIFNNNIGYYTTSYSFYLRYSHNNKFKRNSGYIRFTNDCFFIYNSNNNTFIENFCMSDNYGYSFLNSKNNTLLNNSMLTTGLQITGDSIEHYNTHKIEPTNKLNNKSIYYYSNKNNIKVPNDPGQILLINCTNSIVESLNIICFNTALFLAYSDDNYIANNTFNSEHENIFLKKSNNNTIYNNTCGEANLGIGIYLLESNYNHIINNNFSAPISTGISLSSSKYNSIFNNNFSYCNYAVNIYNSFNNLIKNNDCSISNNINLMIVNSNNNLIANNSCNFGGESGIKLYYSYNNTLNNNTCNRMRYVNGVGITLANADYNYLNNNTCNDNYNGIHARFADNNRLNDNLCFENDGSGVFLEYSANNKLINNTCFENNGNNIEFYSSNSNLLSNNNCTQSVYGIYTQSSPFNLFYNNSCSDNECGIFLSSSHNQVLTDNICNSNNGSGIHLYYSQNNRLSRNICFENNNSGISLFRALYTIINQSNLSKNQNGIFNAYSKDCSFSNNICTDGDWGIYVSEAESNIIESNYCYNNIKNGITLYNSKFCRIENNFCNDNSMHGISVSSCIKNTISKNICKLNKFSGIEFKESQSNHIFNNSCEKNYIGISLYWFSNYNEIYYNDCSKNNMNGIYIENSNYNNISNNSCLKNYNGIAIFESRSNLIDFNNCSENENGFFLGYSNSNTFSNNILFSNTGIGIYFSTDNSNNMIYKNSVYNSGLFGIRFNFSSDSNSIFYNNFIRNSVQAIDYGSNQWDNGNEEGNYWSDYIGLDNGANGRKIGDGIGDTELPHLDLDNYPFMQQNGWLLPNPPILIDPGDLDYDGKYVITWISWETVDGFILEEDNNQRFKSPIVIYKGSNFLFSVSNKDDGIYYYRIRVVKNNFYSAWSNVVNITVEIGPNTPKNLTVEPWLGGNALNVYWEKNNDDTINYELQVRTVGNWILLVNMTHPFNTYNHTGLTDGIEYYYRLRAWDSKIRPSKYTEPVAGIPVDKIAPKPPTGLIIINRTFDSITLSWDPHLDSDVQSFNVYSSLISQPYNWGKPINSERKIKGMQYIDTGLDEGTTYFYVITALDEVPNESSYSKEISAKTYLYEDYPQPPVIHQAPQDLTLLEDTYDDSSINLLTWFSDVNDDTLNFKCHGKKHINVIIHQENGTVILNPNKNWNGEEKLTFSASDGKFELSDNIVITVIPVNDPPGSVEILQPKDGFKIKVGQALYFEGECFDPDVQYGDELTYTWESDISGYLGTGKILTGINLTSGQHKITLIITDMENETATKNINVTVLGPSEDGDKTFGILDESGIFLGFIILIVTIIVILLIVLFLRYRKNKLKSKESEKPKQKVKKQESKRFLAQSEIKPSYGEVEDEIGDLSLEEE